MRKYVLSGLAVAAGVLALQAALPHRLEEGRSTEVLGKMNFYLKLRPAGISLAQISDSFSWEEACVVRQGLPPEEFAAEAQVALPATMDFGEGETGWLLVFVKDAKAVAVAQVPPQALGALDLQEPWACVADQDAFFQIVEQPGGDGAPRRFVLRT